MPWVVIALALAFGLRRLDDEDTWWHLAAGRWIASHGTVPRTDTLSFTVPDHPWTDLQWLFQLTIYGLLRAGGPTLLVLAAAAACGVTVALLVANLRLSVGPAAAAALALWAMAVAQERFAIRPEIVSFVLLEAVLWLCATGRRGGRRLWLLSAVMLVWVNCHSLFVLGAFVIVSHMAGAILARTSLLPAGWREPITADGARRMLVAGGAALLATLLNPYGTSGVVFPLKLYSRISGSNPAFRSIGEFSPPFSGYAVTFSVSAYRLLFVVTVVVVIVAVLLTAISFGGLVPADQGGSRAQRRRATAHGAGPMRAPTPRVERDRPTIDAGGLVLFVGLAALSLLARRNMALFALGASPFVAQCLRAVVARSAGLRRAGEALSRIFTLLLTPAAAAMLWFVATNGFYRWDRELHEFGTGIIDTLFPVRAAAFAREVGLRPPLFNDITSGGYFSWDPPVKGGVYIDGRLEVYDTDFFASYIAALADPSRWQAAADVAGIQTAVLSHWWPFHRPLAQRLLADARWALVYFDDTVLVFVRRTGNEDAIGRATIAFGAARAWNEELLASPVSSWQWPVARARALEMYGAVLDLMGKPDQAVAYYTRFLDLRPPLQEEAGVDLCIAQYHADRGDMALARTYLQRAAEADPEAPGLAQLTARLAH
jgi:tetratricopeptide (TPR) repeat protein